MTITQRLTRFMAIIGATVFSLALVGVLALGGVYWYFASGLPYPKSNVQATFKEPLRVYTADHKLIASFGREKRVPLAYDEIPQAVVDAFIAAEDDRFFQHPGVDYQGILRAALHLLETGRKTQGGSTITMQLARDLYLTDRRTYARKVKEIILAMRLEDRFSKQKIFQLYANKIYLGQGAYGVAAAAHTYYQKSLAQLDIAQVAMLAGLPKAPSALNPVDHPERARQRRNYVLRRMHDLGKISDSTYQQALDAPITAHRGDSQPKNQFRAPYIAEMVRQKMVDRYGDKAYTEGFRVTTTTRSARQRAAQNALRHNLRAYDERHAWHGSGKSVPKTVAQDSQKRAQALADYRSVAGLIPAAVTRVEGDKIDVATRQQNALTIPAARNPWLASGQNAADMVNVGDIVRVAQARHSDDWQLAEIPNVQGAIVALDPHNGAIQALVGGFDFALSKFNRAVQARRQPGSAFKPFLYSAALANGFTPATMVNDAPVVYNDVSLDDSWRPQNYSRRIHGPTRLRTGLVHSRNLVSIRVLRRIGIGEAVHWATRFGLPEDQLPRGLSLALGTATFSPLQMARGYAVFANNGFLIKPHLIQTIERGDGELVYRAKPPLACAQVLACPVSENANSESAQPNIAKRVIPKDNAYLVGDMMRDVIKNGTGRAAQKLDRPDLSGKTGTTNDQIDAWFGGFNADLVAVSWIGFDELKTLGRRETGAHAALPIWIDFMGAALANTPADKPRRPEDIVSVRINPDNGQRALGSGGVSEIFRKRNVPTRASARRAGKHSQTNEVQSLF